jgi:hypothetical protein
MKNADVKSALQKKSPGQRPGRNFLQKEVYQTHNPLVKGQIQYGHAPTMETNSPAKFRHCGAVPHFHSP